MLHLYLSIRKNAEQRQKCYIFMIFIFGIFLQIQEILTCIKHMEVAIMHL